MNTKILRSRPIIIGIGFVVVLLGIKAQMQSEGRGPRSEIAEQHKEVVAATTLEGLKFTNHTANFLVVGKEKTAQGDLRLTLLNGYEKPITAFMVSMGSTENLVDMILSTHEESIAPGKRIDHWLAIDVDPELSRLGVVIQAVVFKDGSADGEKQAIKNIQGYRLGQKMVMERLSAALNRVPAKSDESRFLSTLHELQESLVGASEEAHLPLYVKLGAGDTRKRISGYIDKLRANSRVAAKEKLAQFTEYANHKAFELAASLGNAGQ